MKQMIWKSFKYNFKQRVEITGLVWKVMARNLRVFKKNWFSNIMFNFVEPLLYLAAMGFGLGAFVREINGLPYIQFLAPGIIASSAMWATSLENTYDSFVRMEFQRTFHAQVATPISVDEVVTGEMLYGAFKAVLYASVIIIVLLLLGLVQSWWTLLILPVMIVAGLVFAIPAMSWTGLVPSIDFFNYYFTLIITPMFLFSGIFFPLDGMPALVRVVAWFTPLYHVANLTRNLVLGTVSLPLLYDFLWLAVFVLLFFKIPLALMRGRLIK